MIFWGLLLGYKFQDAPTVSLTDTAIKNAKPKERPYKLADGGGLYVLVNPSGSKLFRLKYRFQGKEKLASFEPHPSLKDARNRRDEMRKALANGENSSGSKKGEIFEAIAREYIDKQARLHKPRYRDDAIRRLEQNVFPDLGHRPIDSIEAPDILTALRKIEARGAYEMAARVTISGRIAVRSNAIMRE